MNRRGFFGSLLAATAVATGLARTKLPELTKPPEGFVPYSWSWTSSDGYELGDTVFITGLAGMVEVNGRAFVVIK